MKIRVLLADDHSVMREGLRLLLESQQDIEVVECVANGREAVQKAKQLVPDIVIMDITMPKLNGIEATVQIRRDAPSVKVIILSAHAHQDHIYRAVRAGAHGYLLKASAGWEVIEAVRAIRAGRRYMSRDIDSLELQQRISRGHATTLIDSLSRREREILQLVVEGRSSKEIAEIVSLSPKTVDSYRSRLMQKLGIEDIPSLVKFAIQFGLTDFE